MEGMAELLSATGSCRDFELSSLSSFSTATTIPLHGGDVNSSQASRSKGASNVPAAHRSSSQNASLSQSSMSFASTEGLTALPSPFKRGNFAALGYTDVTASRQDFTNIYLASGRLKPLPADKQVPLRPLRKPRHHAVTDSRGALASSLAVVESDFPNVTIHGLGVVMMAPAGLDPREALRQSQIPVEQCGIALGPTNAAAQVTAQQDVVETVSRTELAALSVGTTVPTPPHTFSPNCSPNTPLSTSVWRAASPSPRKLSMQDLEEICNVNPASVEQQGQGCASSAKRRRRKHGGHSGQPVEVPANSAVSPTDGDPTDCGAPARGPLHLDSHNGSPEGVAGADTASLAVAPGHDCVQTDIQTDHGGAAPKSRRRRKHRRVSEGTTTVCHPLIVGNCESFMCKPIIDLVAIASGSAIGRELSHSTQSSTAHVANNPGNNRRRRHIKKGSVVTTPAVAGVKRSRDANEPAATVAGSVPHHKRRRQSGLSSSEGTLSLVRPSVIAPAAAAVPIGGGVRVRTPGSSALAVVKATVLPAAQGTHEHGMATHPIRHAAEMFVPPVTKSRPPVDVSSLNPAVAELMGLFC